MRAHKFYFFAAPSSSLVRTEDSQSLNTGSNPVGAILLVKQTIPRRFTLRLRA